MPTQNVIHKTTSGFFTIKSSDRSSPDTGGSIECCISSDLCDRDRDVIIQRGIQYKTFLESNAILLWQHCFTQVPLGRVDKIWLSPDGHRLLAKITFADHDFAREVEKMYRTRMLNAFSIGIRVIQASPAQGNIYGDTRADVTNRALRYIEACELLECSCVTIPSNLEAVQKAFKAKGFRGVRYKADTPRPTETSERAEISTEKCVKCGKAVSRCECPCEKCGLQRSACKCQEAIATLAAKIAHPEFQKQLATSIADAVQSQIGVMQVDKILHEPGGNRSGSMEALSRRLGKASATKAWGPTNTMDGQRSRLGLD
jgi:HK97 family phage prohead protease